jgi:hypothetical protein
MTSNNSSSTEKPGTWIAHHWVTIVMVFVGGIIVLGILKVVSQLFSSNGPLAKGVADVLGGVANLTNGMISGCTSQSACDATTQQDCNNQTGCEWDIPPTSGSAGSCLNTTGREKSNGSFFSTSCVLGMGSIFALCGAIVYFIIGPIVKRLTSKKNEQLDAAEQISGKSGNELRTEAVKKSIKTGEEAKKELEKQRGKPGSDIEMVELGKQSANISTRDIRVDIITKSGSDPQTIAKDTQSAQDAYARDRAQQEQEAKEQGMSQDDIKESEDAVEKAAGDHPLALMNIINDNIRYNIPVLPLTLKYYMEIIKRKNLQLLPHHVQYLNKYHNYYKNIR